MTQPHGDDQAQSSDIALVILFRCGRAIRGPVIMIVFGHDKRREVLPEKRPVPFGLATVPDQISPPVALIKTPNTTAHDNPKRERGSHPTALAHASG